MDRSCSRSHSQAQGVRALRCCFINDKLVLLASHCAGTLYNMKTTIAYARQQFSNCPHSSAMRTSNIPCYGLQLDLQKSLLSFVLKEHPTTDSDCEVIALSTSLATVHIATVRLRIMSVATHGMLRLVELIHLCIRDLPAQNRAHSIRIPEVLPGTLSCQGSNAMDRCQQPLCCSSICSNTLATGLHCFTAAPARALDVP